VLIGRSPTPLHLGGQAQWEPRSDRANHERDAKRVARHSRTVADTGVIWQRGDLADELEAAGSAGNAWPDTGRGPDAWSRQARDRAWRSARRGPSSTGPPTTPQWS
jgi:hypothetical protein